MGVMDRLKLISDGDIDCYDVRPPYHYQVPLEFLPGVGPKTIDKLIDEFGTEMDILHNTSYDSIAAVVGDKTANMIIKAREGSLQMIHGGGGKYGKVEG